MNTETAVAIWKSAEALATKSLEVGKPFLGAWGVAETLGHAKDTPEFKMASSSAYQVFKNREILVNKAGEIVALR